MKRILSLLLVLSLILSATAAHALTGLEALGLGGTESTGYSANYPTLRVGSRDDADSPAYVVALQNRLLELGYLSDAPDGQYGKKTEAAVLRFQQVNALSETGIADDSTQSFLYSEAALAAPMDDLEDSDIVRAQRKLMQWGFLYGRLDGVMGEGTETAVAEFKNYLYTVNSASYGMYAPPAPTAEPAPDGGQSVAPDVLLADAPINVNGHDGKLTEDVMAFIDGEIPFEVYQYAVRSGSSGPEVWRVQRRLRQLGYLYRPDGEFGEMTERALRWFQRKNKLTESGIADYSTQAMLYSESALRSEEYIFPYKIGVDIEEQRVYVFGWDGSGYNVEIDSYKCSTGVTGSDTPTGTYQAAGKANYDEWYYFEEYDCYAKYAFRIVGGVMFHSVLFNSHKKGPTSGSVRNLGKKASHGCVRLAVEDAQWIWENCPAGTTVVIR